MKNFTYVIAPEKCNVYLTANKLYKVIDIRADANFMFFCIKDDNDNVIYCVPKKCAHLNDNDWIIPELEAKYVYIVTKTYFCGSMSDVEIEGVFSKQSDAIDFANKLDLEKEDEECLDCVIQQHIVK